MPLTINRELRLPDSDYFAGPEQKSGICIHHTVGGSARSTFNWWRDDRNIIGTAYIIARDGTVFEVFNPDNWAWQFGLNWPYEDRIAFEKRHIGIEIASEGGLKEHNGNLYCFDRISDRTLKNRNRAFDYGQIYRGYRYFDRYEQAQVDSLSELINDLCTRFTISRQTPADHFAFYGEKLKDFKGIIGHAHVRSDKSDPAPDQSMWDTLISECNLNVTDPVQPLSLDLQAAFDPNELFEHNIRQIDHMHISAGSMIKGLIMELQRDGRDTYIKLRDAVAGGHTVKYDLIKGDPALVVRIADALGFRSATADTLEVRHG
jgi:hypothetical protein